MGTTGAGTLLEFVCDAAVVFGRHKRGTINCSQYSKPVIPCCHCIIVRIFVVYDSRST